MRYWWVNHKQTARQEIGGNYLWSPKREASGARSRFYDNMRAATPGDFILSYASALIRHVGTVVDFAVPSLKPKEFLNTGENWAHEGWLLPVRWQPLTNPIRPKDRIGELGPLLPKKYSPIHRDSGNGNQKAYLAEIAPSVFDLLLQQGPSSHHELTTFSSDGAPFERFDAMVEDSIANDSGLDATTKKQLVLARKGQGLFRDRVSEIERACRLTRIENPLLLVASHVKPWRVCGTAAERLDGSNGLMLAPHVDRLFDRGFISFEKSGEVILSPRLARADLLRLGLVDACNQNCGSFTDRQATFLEFHQAHVLLP